MTFLFVHLNNYHYFCAFSLRIYHGLIWKHNENKQLATGKEPVKNIA